MRRPKRLYAYALFAAGLGASGYVAGMILSRSERSLPFVALWVFMMGSVPVMAFLDWHTCPMRTWKISIALNVMDWSALCAIAHVAQNMKIIPNPLDPSELPFWDSMQTSVFVIGTVVVVLIAHSVIVRFIVLPHVSKTLSRSGEAESNGSEPPASVQ